MPSSGGTQEPDSTRSEMSGSASDVVQARDISGGVHFYRVDGLAEPVPRQLPGSVRGFVNRLSQLNRLDEILTTSVDRPGAAAICVVVGTAGVGKTSLVVHWAHWARDRFPDGQLYVNLRGYDPGELVSPLHALDRFMRAMSVPTNSIPTDLEGRTALYRSLLADRRVLVVLDNASTVRQVRPLLPGTPTCFTVVTSRSRLSGLVARDGAHRITLDLLQEPEAVRLLHEVTAGYRHGDTVEEFSELARLCARLPLALRIAAERAAARPLMPLRELIQDLRDESVLWDALSSEDDEEADSVRAVFAWSFRALPENASRLFRLLGLHPGPEFGIPAAAALGGATPSETRHLLDALAGANLVEQATPGRYQLHDLLRAYARDQAQHEESAESRTQAIHRLLSWYLQTAQAASATLETRYRLIPLVPLDSTLVSPTFNDRDSAVLWFETEWSNLHMATMAAYRAGMDEFTWQMPAAFRCYYEVRNSFDDRLEIASTALAAARRCNDRFGEGECLFTLAVAHNQLGHLDESIRLLQDAAAVWRELSDPDGEGMALTNSGVSLLGLSKVDDAISKFEHAAALFQSSGNRVWESVALANLAGANRRLGRLQQASGLLKRAIQLQEGNSNPFQTWEVTAQLAVVQLDLGDVENALANAQTALARAREAGSALFEGLCLNTLGMAQQASGLPTDALISFQRCAALQREHGDRINEARALDGAGVSFESLGRYDEAIEFHRRAIAVFLEFGQQRRQAEALNHLAVALSRTGARERAQAAWRDALALLAEFTDGEATKMRRRISQMLEGLNL